MGCYVTALRGYKKGVEEGLKKSREERLKKEKNAIVRNLKSLSLPVEIIMQATGLSAEEIEDIK